MATCISSGAIMATFSCSCFLKLQFQELPQIHSHAIHCNSIMSRIAKAIQQILSKLKLGLIVTIDNIGTLLPILTDLTTCLINLGISSNYNKNERCITPVHSTKGHFKIKHLYTSLM